MANKNYIGGRWVTTEAVFPSINPANTDDVLGEFPASSGREAIRQSKRRGRHFPPGGSSRGSIAVSSLTPSRSWRNRGRNCSHAFWRESRHEPE